MARYKPKHIGLKVTLTVPEIYIPVLEVLDSASIGNLIREAMRSAGRPAAVALKNLLKSELVQSDQSTGATERAVDIKYGRSKTNNRRFYLVVGINTKHSEIHTSKVPEGQTTKLNRGRKQRGAGLFGLQTRRNKKGVQRSKQVFSRYRNTRRISNLNGRPFKRIPSKYFPMIDKGFNHRFAGRVNGYNFIQRLTTSLGNSMQKTFESRLKELVIPVIQKELLRKFKSVLR